MRRDICPCCNLELIKFQADKLGLTPEAYALLCGFAFGTVAVIKGECPNFCDLHKQKLSDALAEVGLGVIHLPPEETPPADVTVN